jgi:hypothetical protein
MKYAIPESATNAIARQMIKENLFRILIAGTLCYRHSVVGIVLYVVTLAVPIVTDLAC